jgi:hypothetical protein
VKPEEKMSLTEDWDWKDAEDPEEEGVIQEKPQKKDKCPTNNSNSLWQLTNTRKKTDDISPPGQKFSK